MRWERSLFDSALDALAAIPDWVPRLALVLAAAVMTCGGPLWLAVSMLESLRGLR